MQIRKSCIITTLLFLYSVCPAGAWGADGHSIVAEIAERKLNPRAMGAVRDLLGGQISLASVSGWADQIQMLRPETRGWHFVNIPYESKTYNAETDCNPAPQDCVVNAISRFRAVLRDSSNSHAQRAEALKFLVHFLADIHQPLHTIDRNDAGGSKLEVTFFGAKTNLHAVWDVALIQRRTFYWGAYVDILDKEWLQEQLLQPLSGKTPSEWATDAHKLGVDIAYDLPADLSLGEDYYKRAQPHVDRQLALAGIRLARLLNDIWPEIL